MNTRNIFFCIGVGLRKTLPGSSDVMRPLAISWSPATDSPLQLLYVFRAGGAQHTVLLRRAGRYSVSTALM